MVFSFGGGDQLRDIVVAEAPAETHRARLGSIGFRHGRRKDFIEPHAESRVDDLFEGLMQSGGPFFALAAMSGSSVNVVLMRAS